ncbi:hypothetical protein [Aquimarina agarivorans]|uniref:hypothetical protein n=1 Tax=Aquimarina agarivorans TaxID=980584 RepID=UPI0004986055|nr:hypothetical protein [Aquimarina agarivorans]
MSRFFISYKNVTGLDITVDVINENSLENFTYTWNVDGKLPAIGIKKLENGSYTFDIEGL